MPNVPQGNLAVYSGACLLSVCNSISYADVINSLRLKKLGSCRVTRRAAVSRRLKDSNPPFNPFSTMDGEGRLEARPHIRVYFQLRRASLMGSVLGAPIRGLPERVHDGRNQPVAPFDWW